MSSKYTYLETNTDYSSSELSLRLEDVAGTNSGLNAIDLSSLSLGCFRSNLIPRMIHSSSLPGTVTKDNFTLENDVAFINRDEVNPLGIPGFTGSFPIIRQLEYDESAQYELDMTDTGKQNVGAVIVLANVCVERMVCEWMGEEADATKYAPNEDVVYFDFFIRVIDDAGNKYKIDRSTRSLSPRVTISEKESPRYTGLNTKNPETFLANDDARGDVQTFQDVSIRCVILPSDITNPGRKIHKIAFEYSEPSTFSTGISDGIKKADLIYSKANLTAIPIHTKVS